jgi:hypothetical protein
MAGPERPIAPRADAIVGIYAVLTLVLVGVSLQATLGPEVLAALAPPGQAKVDIIHMLYNVHTMAGMGGARARALVLVGLAEAAGNITPVLGVTFGIVKSLQVAPERVLLEGHKR